ncbi:hypothetical protein TNIN_133791 [Trichonephila inaurata madagascariensis]|uniref:Uncharacterized protein n=1 Tax=Trichonephila inaurata madagascariensis TaxID=2747483 RepID=A0A8X7CC40_9ARAC|nr:hypothetical protein TNIN_133791 [Trichonephila inaurata madagascariensis]
MTFRDGDEDRSDRPVLIATKSTEQRVEELIRANRKVAIDSIVTAIGGFHGLAYSIMYDRLNFQKYARFYLFGPQKQHLGGKQFTDDDDFQNEVLLWMRQQPKEFYVARNWDSDKTME